MVFGVLNITIVRFNMFHNRRLDVGCGQMLPLTKCDEATPVDTNSVSDVSN